MLLYKATAAQLHHVLDRAAIRKLAILRQQLAVVAGRVRGQVQ